MRPLLNAAKAASFNPESQQALASVSTDFMLNLIAYNLIRIPKLLAA